MNYRDFPQPPGQLRAVEHDRYGDIVRQQNDQATARFGKGDVQRLITGDETWTVE